MTPAEHEQLQQIIANYLEAVEAGKVPDRDELLRQHPTLANDLREFFADHDRMHAAAEPFRPTVQMAGGTGGEARPLPRDDSAAVPPSEESNSDDMPLTGDKVRYFGDYELLEEIARGGMGVVYKARQTSLNRIVALKMILAGQLAGEQDVDRFHAEAEAAAQLDHPGIVPIFEVGQHEGRHFFSMGLVEGESLADRLNEGPLPPRDAAELVRQVAEAVAYAHGIGVVHRDL